MVDSGNPSGVLGDSVQQSSVSENSESRTGPPPVNDPHVLAFQIVACAVEGGDDVDLTD